MTDTDLCYCYSGQPYGECCQPYISRSLYPKTAETLMRSRFTAYRLVDLPYLMKTWHPKTRPTLDADVLHQTTWTGLTVTHHKAGLKRSVVSFVAEYLDENETKTLAEESLFKKVKNRWVYVDPIEPQATESSEQTHKESQHPESQS